MPSRLAKFKTSQQLVETYRELLANSPSWLPRLDRTDPAAGARKLKEFEKARLAAERTLLSQQRSALNLVPKPLPYIPIDWTKLPNLVRPRCQTFRGVSQTRMAIVGSVLQYPGDNDSSWSYDATLYSPASGSYHSLMFKHWLNDQTHWYSVDVSDLFWVLHHLGYEFPAPQCNGTMYYEASLALIVSALDNAEAGVLLEEVLLKEVPDAAASPGAPTTYESYDNEVGQLLFTRTEYKNQNMTVSGSFKVKAGRKSRVWFGVAGLATALEGTVGTNGWSYLMVKNPPGESQPGVKYAFIPD